MKRWEWFNKISGGDDSLRKQTIATFVCRVQDHYEHSNTCAEVQDVLQEIDYEKMFNEIENFLSAEETNAVY